MSRIAIVGIGCRFPGGVRDPAGYWSLLSSARCAIGEIPPDRWSLDGFYDPSGERPDRSYCKWGGFLEEIRRFDPGFFGLSPREVEAMDPQQRILLQVAVEAAQDAMMPVSALRAASAGVVVGLSNADYSLMQRYRRGPGDIQAGTGTALSIVANRISNRLDLGGPSMGVDTACSSSLVAVDIACRYLADGTCGAVLAGGVNILLDPRMFLTFCRARMLSPSGRIRAFDARADGFVRGEGVGVVVLKRLEDAESAGDRIYAVIEATAVNQDGATGTITEPDREAQIAMLRKAAAQADIGPGELDYAEAHGTGTPVGDPIEATAIGSVFGGPERLGPLLIGSAKTNIGHLEPAAGIAGLIKAALVMHHRQVPPSLGYERPNPSIAFDELNLQVADKFVPLAADGRPLHALVNSFGFGGTNACVVLSSAGGSSGKMSTAGGMGRVSSARGEVRPLPLPLSAPSQSHLQKLAAALSGALEPGGLLADASLREVAAALSQRLDHFSHRSVIIASTMDELRERLECMAEGRDFPLTDRRAAPQIISGIAQSKRKIAFTMTGQGGQWWEMGRELIRTEPVFRKTIEHFDRHFVPVGGWSVMAELMADEADSHIDDAAITPAVMFAFQTGLANIWRRNGVRPDIVLGHSFGEVTAAFLAGGIREASVAKLVTHRGLIRGAVDRRGTMAAIGLGADEMRELLPTDGSIEIGGYNAPNMVTLTGEEGAIDELIAALERTHPTVLARRLALDFAYHSSWFDPVEDVFKADVGTLDTDALSLPVVSTVTGELNTRFDADYWWQNLRQPVHYQRAVETALELGGDVFVELGPHRTLSAMTAAIAAANARDVVTVTSLDRRWGDLTSIAVATAQLWVAGVEIDWRGVAGSDARRVSLPLRPWSEETYWHEPEEARRALRSAVLHPLLGMPDSGPRPTWTAELSLATHGWLAGHRIEGSCLVPAAVYIEMLVAAASVVLAVPDVELIDVRFPAGLYLGAGDEIQLVTAYMPERRRLTVHSRLRDGSGDWQLRAEATAYAATESQAREMHACACCDEAGVEPLDPAAFYRRAAQSGYGWKDQFRGLKHIALGVSSAAGVISILPPASNLPRLRFDPRTLDCAMQLMIVQAAAGLSDDHSLPALLPAAIDRVVAFGDVGGSARATATLRLVQDIGLLADVSIEAQSDNGSLMGACRLLGVHARSRWRSDVEDAPHAARFYNEVLEPVERAGSAASSAGDGIWLWIGSGEDADTLASASKGKGANVRLVTLAGLEGMAQQRDAIAAGIAETASSGAPAGIVLVASRSELISCSLVEHAERQAAALIALGQALAESSDRVGSVWILTIGARGLEESGLAGAGMWSAARTIALELPDIDMRLVDIDEATLSDPVALFDVLGSKTSETEFVIRGRDVQVPRLVETTAAELPARSVSSQRLGRGQGYALRRLGAAGPGSLAWQQCQRPQAGYGEAEIEIKAVGLNFRDVMAVSGLLPDHAERTPPVEALGLEFCGVVRAVGPDSDGWTVGDRVFGMGRGVLRSSIVAPVSSLYPAPDDLADEDVAGLASAYLTAYAALIRSARLAAGETVLIQNASGGVGLAAVNVARHAGARVIATAGTDEKRACLRSLGIADIFDSRSLAFADDVLRVTDGRGADVILNALQGPFIDKGLACLAPYGRFIEIGKRDVLSDSAIGLQSLRRNGSFHVVDLAAMLIDRPDSIHEMMAELLELFADGTLQPLPVRVYEAGDIQSAFRAFSDGDHIGKIVVRLSAADLPVRSALSGKGRLDGNGTYLVTGGTRGFGLAVGRWLADMGAGRVVLASRNPDHVEGDDRLETIALDVADADAVIDAVRVLSGSGKPLRGLVHAAVAYDDALISDVTDQRLARVMTPKVAGVVNLTNAVVDAGCDLEFFVSFGSLAGVVGWPAQASYAAANGFLSAFAQWQRSRGIPGISIDWGALGEAGYVARSDGMTRYLQSAGWHGIGNQKALGMLAAALDCDAPNIMIAAADWPRLAATHPPIARAPRLAQLTGHEGRAAVGAPGRLHELSGADLMNAALDLAYGEAARVLRMPAAELRGIERLSDAGIDSLSSFELRNRIEQAAGVSLPLDSFTRAASFAELAALIAARAREA